MVVGIRLLHCERVWQAVIPLDLKLVSVKFEALGAVLPTLYLGFYPAMSKLAFGRIGHIRGFT